MEIIGHKKILDLLDKSVVKNSVSQAYLFSGFPSVGKFPVALHFAEKILGQSSNKISDSLIILEADQKAALENSAAKETDKKGQLKKSGKEIKVDEVRELRRKLFLSSETGRKVAIVRGAEKLNKASQNALLKILEEPTAGLTLILVADDEKKLFPTIISRCQKIRFGIIADKEIGKLIDSQGKNLNAETKREMIFWSVGRPGLTWEMLQNPEKLEFRIQSFKEIQGLFRKTVLDKFSLAENLAKDAGLTLLKMNIWTIGLRNLLLADGTRLASREKYLEIMEKINESQKLLKQTNANAKLILENLFLTFSKE